MTNKAVSQKAVTKNSRTIVSGAAYGNVLKVADRLKAYFETVVKPFGITGQQYNVLRILRGSLPDGLPTLTIAERMIENTPGITGMIDRLEAKELVGREPCRKDRRCVFCKISDKGLEVLAALDDSVKESNKTAFNSLDKAEILQLNFLLEKILKNGKQNDEQNKK